MIAEPKALAMAVRNRKATGRGTRLAWRLAETERAGAERKGIRGRSFLRSPLPFGFDAAGGGGSYRADGLSLDGGGFCFFLPLLSFFGPLSFMVWTC